jgi:hypothetical protein
MVLRASFSPAVLPASIGRRFEVCGRKPSRPVQPAAVTLRWSTVLWSVEKPDSGGSSSPADNPTAVPLNGGC